ncbi:hypothetical protein F5887DRAFT_521140 [Amanita rubescens]|nr:hypothetical protein F5887DRAFT_521140 [Amanita rubescens]
MAIGPFPFPSHYPLTITSSIRLDSSSTFIASGLKMEKIVSPTAQNLPVDIIQNIFGYFSTSLRLSYTSKGFPWFLGHVCSAWRAIFLTMTTEFWQSISLDYRWPSEARQIKCILEMTRFFVARNREETISFSYLLPTDDWTHGQQGVTDLRRVLEVLVEESMRWESVSIETASLDLPTLQRVKDRLPSLRSLMLRIPVHHSSNTPPGPGIFENAPSLQEVTLVGHFNWKLNWSSLTALELGQAHFERDELGILSRALNVETLTIQHASAVSPVTGSSAPIPQTIKLPHLKWFSLQGNAQFLTVLEAPKLDELKLEFHINRDLASVTSFLSRSSCTIRRLALKSVAQSAFGEILRRTPEIEHLELRRQSNLIHYLEALDASPRNSSSGGEERLARHLKSLTVAASAYRISISKWT